MKIKHYLPGFLIMAVSLISINANSQTGEDLFNLCKACHTVGGGRLVGPDLSGIASKRDEAWLIKFIKSSQTVINSGDADAVKVFEEYNKILMPDQALSDAEIKLVLKYISEADGSSDDAAGNKPVAPPVEYLLSSTQQNIDNGKQLFLGKKRLLNGGPNCIACHSVKDYSSGTLAIDLTDSHGKLKSNGVKAILSAPPFPAMNNAYSNKLITDSEVFDLTSYLRYINQQQLYVNKAGDAGPQFLLFSLLSFVVFMIIIGLVWVGRKKSSVKEDILNRQASSIN